MTESKSLPQVVIIVSDAPLIDGVHEQVAGRAAVYVPILSPELPLPALATTVITGVHPITHGIVTLAEIEEKTLNMRPIKATDRLFPAFWSERTITTLIGWPGVVDDEDLQYEQSQAMVQRKLLESDDCTKRIDEKINDCDGGDTCSPKTRMQVQLQLATVARAQAYLQEFNQTEVLGIALKSSDEEVPSSVTSLLHAEVEAFITSLAMETNVVLVQRTPEKKLHSQIVTTPYVATYLLQYATHEVTFPVELPSVGGSIYRMTGQRCPHGVTEANWNFLPPIDTELARPFPLASRKDERDWQSIAERLQVQKEEDPQGTRKTINLVVRRWIVLSNVALWYHRWDLLEKYSTYLIELRGATRDHWNKLLALHRLGKTEEAKLTSATLERLHPNIPVTILANALTVIESDPNQARALLQTIELEEIKISSALGIYGVLSIRTDLTEQGTEALEKAMQIGLISLSERAVLAESYLKKQEYKKALQTLGKVGSTSGSISWRLLRLKIYVALEETEFAEKLAASILETDPNNQAVQQILRSN
jgi:tetratricopeptide (TPR) repeat protein